MASAAQARKLGRTVFAGDSITQGFDSSIYPSSPQASYRYQFWKGLTDNGLVYGRDYTFVGSQQGSCHKGGHGPHPGPYLRLPETSLHQHV